MANIFKCVFPCLLQVFEADSKELWESWAYHFEETNYMVLVPVPTSKGHMLWFLYDLAETLLRLRGDISMADLLFDSYMVLFNVF